MLKEMIKNLAAKAGNRFKPRNNYSNPDDLEKATCYIERYREIVSDPLNVLIRRVPDAGYITKAGCVILHNGNRVPIQGKYAYYKSFSDILIINRGVHEPLEEYCFQSVLEKINSSAPVMIELGAYWSHYSMWLKRRYPSSVCYMVEPDENNLECGRQNFKINGFDGVFVKALVGDGGFQLDRFVEDRGLESIEILHSDIQGHEVKMLEDARRFLGAQKAKYIFISTHSNDLHGAVIDLLKKYAYRVEVESDFETHTTSSDGFVFASAPTVPAIFENFHPLGRVDIAKSSPEALLASINHVKY